MRDFLTTAERGGLLFDGAIGSLLYERGVYLTRCFEQVSVAQPELVRRVHEEYLQAGAQVLTTNTFGANRVKLEKHGVAGELPAINEAGVRLAREVAGGRAWVAGSVGPTGLGLRELVGEGWERARAALDEQIRALVDLDVDVLCLETFSVLQELELAIELARAVTERPIVAQLTFGADARALGGQTPEQVGRRLIEAGADVIGSNCGGGPDLLFQVTTPMVPLGRPVLAQANAGRPEVIEGRTIYVANPEYFGVFARRLLKAGVRVLGGCCGTNPEHIRRMANAARMFNADDRAPAPHLHPVGPVVVGGGAGDGGSGDGGAVTGGAPASSPLPAAVPLANRSDLGARLVAGEFVTSVELNPPNGFDLRGRIRAARALRDAGVTTVNIADGPRASLRMCNVAMAVEVQRETGLSPLVHVCARDRNFLGLLSHLLGMHVHGLRNLVIITGDPPKMGPYPHATAVYDVDSVGLLNVARGFNHGLDPAGEAMSETTAFVLATGAEPAALDYPRELRRLAMKRDAGAEVVMTQPVYDPIKVERFLDDTAALGLPVMLGLCPLASSRNARFLHENVPGMQVPGYILDRMAAADARGEGQAEGVRIAREALAAVRDRVQGAYIMPPFGRTAVALEVLEGYLTPPKPAE